MFFNFLNDHPKNCLFYCIIGTSSFRSYVLISCTMYCTTGHMYYLGVVYPHLQYPCIAPRVICTIVELYIHMYNIIVIHHGSYVLSWSCISTFHYSDHYLYYRSYVLLGIWISTSFNPVLWTQKEGSGILWAIKSCTKHDFWFH